MNRLQYIKKTRDRENLRNTDRIFAKILIHGLFV